MSGLDESRLGACERSDTVGPVVDWARATRRRTTRRGSSAAKSSVHGASVYTRRAALDSRAGGSMTDEKPVPVKVTIDETTAEGHYVNFANILHNPTEFVLDFGRVVPGRRRRQGRQPHPHDAVPRASSSCARSSRTSSSTSATTVRSAPTSRRRSSRRRTRRRTKGSGHGERQTGDERRSGPSTDSRLALFRITPPPRTTSPS